jgi:TctA family transporter
MPFTILTPIIFILCFVGVFSTTDRMFDVWLMIALGLGGYLLRKLNYPVAPAVLAIVLGPLAERSMRQSLIGSRGDATTFINPVEHPISLGCIISRDIADAVSSVCEYAEKTGGSERLTRITSGRLAARKNVILKILPGSLQSGCLGF